MEVPPNHQEKFRGRKARVLSDNGYDYLDYYDTKGLVIIVPVTENNELILIEQFRIPLQKNVIEFPAGAVGDEAGFENESFEMAARRELLEESGYDCEKLTYLTKGPASPGSITEIATLFLAKPAIKKNSGGGVGDENITTHCIPLDSVPAWLIQKQAENILIDPRIYTGLYFINQTSQ